MTVCRVDLTQAHEEHAIEQATLGEPEETRGAGHGEL